MSEADFCYDAGQYYADQSLIEHDRGPASRQDVKIANQKLEIEHLKKKVQRLKSQIKVLQDRLAQTDREGER